MSGVQSFGVVEATCVAMIFIWETNYDETDGWTSIKTLAELAVD
jgi:hypothetical protein